MNSGKRERVNWRIALLDRVLRGEPEDQPEERHLDQAQPDRQQVVDSARPRRAPGRGRGRCRRSARDQPVRCHAGILRPWIDAPRGRPRPAVSHGPRWIDLRPDRRPGIRPRARRTLGVVCEPQCWARSGSASPRSCAPGRGRRARPATCARTHRRPRGSNWTPANLRSSPGPAARSAASCDTGARRSSPRTRRRRGAYGPAWGSRHR